MKNAVTREHVAVVNFAHRSRQSVFRIHCAERKAVMKPLRVGIMILVIALIMALAAVAVGYLR